MISETQQEQASLYALGLLDADEADAFEREMTADPALLGLVRDLDEAAASLALAAGKPDAPPSALKAKILGAVAPEPLPVASRSRSSSPYPRPLILWALAALLLGCVAFLAVDRVNLRGELSHLRTLAAATAPAPDVFSQVSFCELEPTPDAPMKPRAAVLWDPARRRGLLRIAQLDPAASGHDYQLWAVETARKEPVNAGLVHVDAAGRAAIPFQPDPVPGDTKVVALAISLEQAGGSPTNQGPILFLGKF